MSDNGLRVVEEQSIDNMRGGTQRVIQENTINNMRGSTRRVIVVGGGGGAVSSVNGQTGDVVITGNDVLPDQTGQSGKFLTTDGTDASWSDKPLVNTATGTNSLTIFGTPTTTVRALNIGYNTSATTNAPNATAIGYNCVADGNSALAIGADAKATGEGSVAINGKANMPNATARAVAIGAKVSGDKSIVIMTGYSNYYTNITASYATVLGYISNPNTIESNSFYVGVGMNENQTIKLLGSDGTIPAARHAALPAVDGTYTLQLVITNGVPTLSWVAV